MKMNNAKTLPHRTLAHLLLATVLATTVRSGMVAPAADLALVGVAPEWTTALRLRDTGKPYVAVGVNYFGPHDGWAPKLWQQFDADRVRKHLQLLRDQGFNTIRVFLPLDLSLLVMALLIRF